MSKSESRLKQTTVCARLTLEEKLLLQEKACAAKITVSQLLVRSALNRRIVTKTDTKLMGQLLQTAGLLKHLYNQMRDDHMTPELSRQFSEALIEVKKAVVRLDLDAVPVGGQK